MDSARIAALLEPFLEAPLSPVQLDQISTYIDLLLHWNARINLTAIRDPEQIAPRHFGESFFLARYLFPAESNSETRVGAGVINSGEPTTPARVIDLGSGAGFPALPIKIWAPEIHLTLIESNHKKAAFLREIVRSLTLTKVDVIAERAGTVLARLPHSRHSGQKQESVLPQHQEGQLRPADVVTFRAVEKFDKVLPLAASFLAPHGHLALLISSAQESRLSALPGPSWRILNIPQSHSKILAISE